ncbi:MAG: energy transducer TonB, partial [Thermoanaerobaculia bacterium]
APGPAVTQTVAPAPAVKEGDLVDIGTPGLNPPQIVERGNVTYPAAARRMGVEGIVVLQVLVSETGRPLQVKVLRGVPLLNAAAIESARTSKYRPATKDGVRVKSHMTFTIPFKL